MQGLKSPTISVGSNISTIEGCICLIGKGKQEHPALCWKDSPAIKSSWNRKFSVNAMTLQFNFSGDGNVMKD
jgi:hypothetical protein